MRNKSNSDDLLQALFARLDLVQRDNVKPIRKIAIFEMTFSKVRKFKSAIFKNTVVKADPFKITGIENAIGKYHLPIGALEDAWAGQHLGGDDDWS